DPHPVGEAGAHGLDDRLLGGEAHGEEALGALGEGQLRHLRRQQERLREARAEALEGACDALHLEHVHPDAVDHARAASISAFISRTACASPTNSACAMIACPMLSSTMSGNVATGGT